jgi:hypothetical protein
VASRTSARRANRYGAGTLLAKGAVEALDVRILIWLAGLDVPQGHAVDPGPLDAASPRNSGPLSVRGAGGKGRSRRIGSKTRTKRCE